jgi:hypothetical protein
MFTAIALDVVPWWSADLNTEDDFINFFWFSFSLQSDADNDDDDYDLQNAGFSEFQIPDIAIASALYTNIPTLNKIRANISEHEAGNLEALQKSPLAHCVPGKNISDFDDVLRTMGIGNRNHLLRSLKSA